MLDADDIGAEAELRVGIDDSDHALHPNLERLVAALNEEARLPPRGAASARKALVDRTSDRLEGSSGCAISLRSRTSPSWHRSFSPACLVRARPFFNICSIAIRVSA